MQDSNENRQGTGGLSPDNGGKSLEGWNIPKPEAIPSPTHWPFMLSLGATLMGLGILTSNLISIVGIVLFILAIVKWVGELSREERH